MRVAFFEDAEAGKFQPLSLARPVFELICGRYSLRERIVRHCPATEWGVFLRKHLAETYREAHPEAHVNDFTWLGRGPTLVINGRWLPSADAIRQDLAWERVAIVNGRVAFMMLDRSDAPRVMRDGWDGALLDIAKDRPPMEARGQFLENLWDSIGKNGALLADDFRLAGAAASPYEPALQVAVIGPVERLQIDPSADRTVCGVGRFGRAGLDRAGGGSQAVHAHHGSVPCRPRFAARRGDSSRTDHDWSPLPRRGRGRGHDSSRSREQVPRRLFGAQLPVPLGEPGMLTTNSDLKNDYSNIRVPVSGETVDTGLTKIGCFIGDHAKTGIGSLLNTGASIGAMAMILPDGQLSPKHVPSFCKAALGGLADGIDLERALRTARIAMARRNCELTAAQERLWRRLFVQTREERETAILRFRNRDFSRDPNFPQSKAG